MTAAVAEPPAPAAGELRKQPHQRPTLPPLSARAREIYGVDGVLDRVEEAAKVCGLRVKRAPDALRFSVGKGMSRGVFRVGERGETIWEGVPEHTRVRVMCRLLGVEEDE